MSVVPEDSASAFGVGSSTAGSVVLPYGIDLSKCVFTADDYLRVVQAVGVGEAAALRTFMDEQLKFLKQCANTNSSAVRLSSSPGSVVSSLGSGSRSASPDGLLGSRLGAIRRMGSWRARSVPDGLCYSKLLRPSVVSAEVGRLGKWPTVAALLRSPASAFQSVQELERFRVVGDSDAVHVRAGGSDGFSFLSSVSAVAGSSKYPDGTFGAVVKAHGKFPGPSGPLSGRTCVGGVFDAEKLPFVKPACRGLVSASQYGYSLVDLLSLPSSWFLSLRDTNSLWLSPSAAAVSQFEFSLTGTVHFNSFVVEMARSLGGFGSNSWGFSLVQSDCDFGVLDSDTVVVSVPAAGVVFASGGFGSGFVRLPSVPQDAVSVLSSLLGNRYFSPSSVESSLAVRGLDRVHQYGVVLLATQSSKEEFRAAFPSYSGSVYTVSEAQGSVFDSCALVRLMGDPELSPVQSLVALTRYSVAFTYLTFDLSDHLSVEVSRVTGRSSLG